MSERNSSRVTVYAAVTAVFCVLVAIITTADPFPALRIPLQLASVVVLVVMAYLLGRETRTVRKPEKETEAQD
ncbi:hypothetical protein NE857_11245 [Nocardiopsis exhalans]|uniref:Uncharacterized protein n=1 Tax=Nocardiopsis exhalans TaxID=163604 RepID=A0ABY5DDV8_9ACTN|nr:hypothetical protein [Nocardiopsis exhalans]USY22125.1 hypothetical protein NE857_11245 [Nocardiopsis exhalans]